MTGLPVGHNKDYRKIIKIALQASNDWSQVFEDQSHHALDRFHSSSPTAAVNARRFLHHSQNTNSSLPWCDLWDLFNASSTLASDLKSMALRVVNNAARWKRLKASHATLSWLGNAYSHPLIFCGRFWTVN